MGLTVNKNIEIDKSFMLFINIIVIIYDFIRNMFCNASTNFVTSLKLCYDSAFILKVSKIEWCSVCGLIFFIFYETFWKQYVCFCFFTCCEILGGYFVIFFFYSDVLNKTWFQLLTHHPLPLAVSSCHSLITVCILWFSSATSDRVLTSSYPATFSVSLSCSCLPVLLLALLNPDEIQTCSFHAYLWVHFEPPLEAIAFWEILCKAWFWFFVQSSNPITCWN